MEYTARKVSVFGVFLVSIQSECGKLRTRKTQNTDTFRAVIITLLLSKRPVIVLSYSFPRVIFSYHSFLSHVISCFDLKLVYHVGICFYFVGVERGMEVTCVLVNFRPYSSKVT